MRAGKLRDFITIQENTPTQSESGEPTAVWSTFAEVWAEIEPLKGREYSRADKVDADVDYKIRIRYCPGVVASMRVSFDSQTFDIESVLNVGRRNREMHLMCRERL